MSHTEAMRSNESKLWAKAETEEIDSLVEHGTWEVVPRPQGKNVVSCRWVYRVKYGQGGEVTCYKARLVAHGFSQIHGIDYQETFAPVTRLETIRLLLALAVEKDWEARQVDVKTAYLYGDLDEEIFMEAPEGYDVPEGHCLLLKKALYGLKQAGRQWYLKLKETLREFGLEQVKSEPHTFKTHKYISGKKLVLIVPVYVDDLFLFGDKALTDEFEEWLPTYFQTTPPTDVSYFLGIRATRDRGEVNEETGKTEDANIILDQVAFIDSVLKRLTIPLKEKHTPLPLVEKLVSNPEPKENTNPDLVRSYQSAIGSLMYIMLGTRPDLAFAVGKLASFASNPSPEHQRAISHMFCYLNKTKDLSLRYQYSEEIASPVGFCDADWANSTDPENKRCSVSGACFFLSSAVFSWSSKKQAITAESTMEAEYITLWATGRQASWIRQFYKGITFPLESPVLVLTDLQSVIALATRTEVQHKGSKHFDVKYHSTKDRVERNEIKVSYVKTQLNVADIFTKSLPREVHKGHAKSLELGESNE